jgi:hypothetical protein
MWSRLKTYSLVACLFVFLFLVVGAGLHLSPTGALAAALSGTPLVIHVVKRWIGHRPRAAVRSRAATKMKVATKLGELAAAETEDDAEQWEDLAPRGS